MNKRTRIFLGILLADSMLATLKVTLQELSGFRGENKEAETPPA